MTPGAARRYRSYYNTYLKTCAVTDTQGISLKITSMLNVSDGLSMSITQPGCAEEEPPEPPDPNCPFIRNPSVTSAQSPKGSVHGYIPILMSLPSQPVTSKYQPSVGGLSPIVKPSVQTKAKVPRSSIQVQPVNEISRSLDSVPHGLPTVLS